MAAKWLTLIVVFIHSFIHSFYYIHVYFKLPFYKVITNYVICIIFADVMRFIFLPSSSLKREHEHKNKKVKILGVQSSTECRPWNVRSQGRRPPTRPPSPNPLTPIESPPYTAPSPNLHPHTPYPQGHIPSPFLHPQ
jgi:hypothetical protein